MAGACGGSRRNHRQLCGGVGTDVGIKEEERPMKNSLIILIVFFGGIAVGKLGMVPESFPADELASWTLYVLIAIVGYDLGNRSFSKTIRSITPRVILLPLATIVGTLLFVGVAGMIFLPGIELNDCLAIGSGLGYYSLSSMLVMDLRAAHVGAQMAAELGIIALLANLIREMIALVGMPFIRKVFGYYAPICASGVTSIDVTLPMIMRTCGTEAMPLAVIHGAVLEFMVPVLVTLFCAGF